MDKLGRAGSKTLSLMRKSSCWTRIPMVNYTLPPNGISVTTVIRYTLLIPWGASKTILGHEPTNIKRLSTIQIFF